MTAYASRVLSQSECNYPVHKLEFLALKLVTDKFTDHLYESRFTVKTDNNPLLYVSSAKLDARGHRCLTELANCDFDLQYICDKLNVDAEFLSQLPSEKIDCAEVETVCHSQQASGFVKSLCVDSTVYNMPIIFLPNMSESDWSIYQWSNLELQVP